MKWSNALWAGVTVAAGSWAAQRLGILGSSGRRDYAPGELANWNKLAPGVYSWRSDHGSPGGYYEPADYFVKGAEGDEGEGAWSAKAKYRDVQGGMHKVKFGFWPAEHGAVEAVNAHHGAVFHEGRSARGRGARGRGASANPDTSERRDMPAREFALPRRAQGPKFKRTHPSTGAYPMDTRGRAIAARGYAIKELNAGNLTVREAQTILDRTSRKWGFGKLGIEGTQRTGYSSFEKS